MPQADLILIHAPAVFDFRERSVMYGPVSDMVPSTPVFEMYPLGFATIGEYLERHDVRVRIHNLAVRMLIDPKLNVEQDLGRFYPKAFGIDLHWLPHCHGAIEVARLLKRLHPEIPVIFGGLSATYYAQELIEFDCVDYVLRGDSTEEPFLDLMQVLKASSVTASIQTTGSPAAALAEIPNLSWKDQAGCITHNPLSWVPDDFDHVALDYQYPMRGAFRDRSFSSYLPFKSWASYPIVASICSRGCDRNCYTCGGSHTAFDKHFGRQHTAWRDPGLLVRDITEAQRHIWGPLFLLNDLLMGGRDYSRQVIEGLRGKLINPIGFEFFGPPPGGREAGRELYQLMSRNLPGWSVEISAESHDDTVRTAFGKGHYSSTELEDTITDALAAGCQRFDLYFMTGIPGQTAKSILATGEYVLGLYERVGNDPRLRVFIAPMAPFLDIGSRAFDDALAARVSGLPAEYNLLATTLAEHRQRMLMPSWKHIMNYRSQAIDTDTLVEATYQAAFDINRAKAAAGVVDQSLAIRTGERILRARDQMRQLDELLDDHGGPSYNPSVEQTAALKALKAEFEQLSESTVAEKSELSWEYRIKPSHLLHDFGVLANQESRNLKAWLRGSLASAASPNYK
ncbi:MAG: TIGR04190 family B12-binding domain/radical SAM domain protein [Coriobacteriales bacterium]|jgi:B12-binding domain/radical SAM domain protein|nr:TIGR04190 family B12-binding domain/radical SAM domain protein [Coriobacteriales bacterium]